MPVHNFTPLEGRLVDIEIQSAALADNRLGDPATRRVGVYLPPGHDEADTGYPLLVDLVGFTGSGYSHLSWKAFHETVPQRVERLVRSGAMGPVIVAFPDCFTSLGGNQYINSAATGRWADFLLDDMVPALEERFRVRPGPAHRGCFGKSSGGYGSIVHGLRYGDRWGAVACHSGDMAFEWCYLPTVPATLAAIAKRGGLGGFLDHVDACKKLADDDFHALMTLAMGATYDPDPDAPKGVSVPADLYTGAFDTAAWERWVAHDPVRLIEDPACQARLRGMAGVYVDCGERDQYGLVYGARQFTARLGELGIPHTYEEFDDNHSGIDYRMDVSLPFLYRALGGRS